MPARTHPERAACRHLPQRRREAHHALVRQPGGAAHDRHTPLSRVLHTGRVVLRACAPLECGEARRRGVEFYLGALRRGRVHGTKP